jgi:hypothetical protein
MMARSDRKLLVISGSCFAGAGTVLALLLLANFGHCSPYDRPLQVYLMAPCRLLDTRIPGPAPGEWPEPGEDYARGGPLKSGVIRRWIMQGDACVPLGSQAILVTVTVTRATGPGHLQLWDSNGPQPYTSVVNFQRDQAVASTTTVALGQLVGQEPGIPFWPDLAAYLWVGGGGQGTAHLILDVVGVLR